MPEQKHLVDVRDLKQYFTVKAGMLNKMQLKAVDGVSFTIDEGETLGLVGESGCGKTTLGRSMLRLIEPTSGDVIYRGKNLVQMPGSEMRKMRKEMQIILQDPYSSLNQRLTIGEALM